MKFVSFFLALILSLQNCWAAGFCLRFPGAGLQVMKEQDCETNLDPFERNSRPTTLQLDYERFLSEQDKNPKLAWHRFMKRALAKLWSVEDESLMFEMADWSRRQTWVVDPVLEKSVRSLQTDRELKLSPQKGRESWVEALAQLPGWEDVVIQTLADEGENEDGPLQDFRVRRWVLYSSVYLPVVVWGTAKEIASKLREGQKPWLQGHCLQPQWDFDIARGLAVRAIDGKGCVSRNLAKAAAKVQVQDQFQPQASAFPGVSPKIDEKATTSNWLWWGLFAGMLAASYALKDKTVVITRGL